MESTMKYKIVHGDTIVELEMHVRIACEYGWLPCGSFVALHGGYYQPMTLGVG